MNNLDLYTHCAREAVGLPEGWTGVIFTTVGHPSNSQGVMVRGAVCPPKTRGPDKGGPAWARRDRATECEVFVSREAFAKARQAIPFPTQSNKEA
ncbi:hypothetical protein ACQKQD_18835 [Methylobacterium sp. NPDC080182]|uniref:hypothetical protein n=1 Tax=Methylobacterium sp. NPDC080182 TaxID=3390590 RepID=UPI003D08F51B